MNDEIYPDKIIFYNGEQIIFSYGEKIYDGRLIPTPNENIVEVLTKEIRFKKPN